MNELFVVDSNDKGTRGHSCKLKKARYTRDIVKFFFQIRSSTDGMFFLDQSAVDAPSINAFKSHWKRSGANGWASLWISPLSPGSCWLMIG